MRRVRRLLVALVVVIGGWGAAWVASSARGARCDPDDLTGCDALGSVLLFLLLFGLPIVLLALLIFLVLDVITSRGRLTRSGRDEEEG